MYGLYEVVGHMKLTRHASMDTLRGLRSLPPDSGCLLQKVIL